MCVTLTTGEDEVWGAQKYVREGLQESEINQVCEETDSHHQHWKAFEHIEAYQHPCRELDTSTEIIKTTVDLHVQHIIKTST